MILQETDIKPSKNREEHQKRAEKCFDFDKLKVGERRMFVLPAYDFRGGEDNTYGQHSAGLIFAKRGKRTAVHVTFFTGWCVTGVSENGFMCAGLSLDQLCTATLFWRGLLTRAVQGCGMKLKKN